MLFRSDFDRPAMSPNCVARVESTVAPQALHLLNSRMVHELSRSLAERVMQSAGTDRAKQIAMVHRLVLGRAPEETEWQEGLAGLTQLESLWRESLGGDNGDKSSDAARRALDSYCHAMLNSAALIFVE